MAARTPEAHAHLRAQLSAHSVEKTHLALVWGVASDQGEVERLVVRQDGRVHEAKQAVICLMSALPCLESRVVIQTHRGAERRPRPRVVGPARWLQERGPWRPAAIHLLGASFSPSSSTNGSRGRLASRCSQADELGPEPTQYRVTCSSESHAGAKLKIGLGQARGPPSA